MILPSSPRSPRDLLPAVNRLFSVSAGKVRLIEETWRPDQGAPVFTVEGRYQARGWTEWTQGFQFGSALLQFDATDEAGFLDLGRSRTIERMAPHLTHLGVHDHGFNNVSTYGTLWRLAREGRFEATDWEVIAYELALKVSAAVQARRWTAIPDGGFIHSFNGAHSLFVDTIRSLRSLALGVVLRHRLLEEQDASVDLLLRLVQHARATSEYNVYYGRGRDRFDVRGRVAHESLFNVVNGSYRGPSTQQGYSPFTTWTRGLAWAMLGFAEQLEFLASLPNAMLETSGGRDEIMSMLLDAARATSDFYIDSASATDGIPYWDTGAPGLASVPQWHVPKPKKWSEEELNLLRQLWTDKSFSIDEVAAKLNKTRPATHFQAWKMGLRRPQVWHFWTQEETQYLKKNFKKKSHAEIAKDLGMTKIAVFHKAIKLGLRLKRAPHPWTEADDEYIRQNYRKIPTREIAQKLDRSLDAIINRAGPLGISRRKRKQ